MVSTWAICEQFKLNSSGLLRISQSVSVCIDGSVVETICWTCFSALTLVDWNVFPSVITFFANGKEKWIRSLSICRYIKLAWNLSMAIFLFFSCNLDFPTHVFLWILESAFKSLIFAGDDFMHGEWIWPDEILFSEIIEVSSIISIINFHNEFLVFFEREIGLNGCNPLWIEVIIDDFGDSKSHLFSILDLKHHRICVTLWLFIQIWEAYTFQVNDKCLVETCTQLGWHGSKISVSHSISTGGSCSLLFPGGVKVLVFTLCAAAHILSFNLFNYL